ncbi:unnamed protein product, partial [Prorocentrum cordatum]
MEACLEDLGCICDHLDVPPPSRQALLPRFASRRLALRGGARELGPSDLSWPQDEVVKAEPPDAARWMASLPAAAAAGVGVWRAAVATDEGEGECGRPRPDAPVPGGGRWGRGSGKGHPGARQPDGKGNSAAAWSSKGKGEWLDQPSAPPPWSTLYERLAATGKKYQNLATQLVGKPRDTSDGASLRFCIKDLVECKSGLMSLILWILFNVDDYELSPEDKETIQVIKAGLCTQLQELTKGLFSGSVGGEVVLLWLAFENGLAYARKDGHQVKVHVSTPSLSPRGADLRAGCGPSWSNVKSKLPLLPTFLAWALEDIGIIGGKFPGRAATSLVGPTLAMKLSSTGLGWSMPSFGLAVDQRRNELPLTLISPALLTRRLRAPTAPCYVACGFAWQSRLRAWELVAGAVLVEGARLDEDLGGNDGLESRPQAAEAAGAAEAEVRTPIAGCLAPAVALDTEVSMKALPALWRDSNSSAMAWQIAVNSNTSWLKNYGLQGEFTEAHLQELLEQKWQNVKSTISAGPFQNISELIWDAAIGKLGDDEGEGYRRSRGPKERPITMADIVEAKLGKKYVGCAVIQIDAPQTTVRREAKAAAPAPPKGPPPRHLLQGQIAKAARHASDRAELLSQIKQWVSSCQLIAPRADALKKLPHGVAHSIVEQAKSLDRDHQVGDGIDKIIKEQLLLHQTWKTSEEPLAAKAKAQTLAAQGPAVAGSSGAAGGPSAPSSGRARSDSPGAAPRGQSPRADEPEAPAAQRPPEPRGAQPAPRPREPLPPGPLREGPGREPAVPERTPRDRGRKLKQAHSVLQEKISLRHGRGLELDVKWRSAEFFILDLGLPHEMVLAMLAAGVDPLAPASREAKGLDGTLRDKADAVRRMVNQADAEAAALLEDMLPEAKLLTDYEGRRRCVCGTQLSSGEVRCTVCNTRTTCDCGASYQDSARFCRGCGHERGAALWGKPPLYVGRRVMVRDPNPAFDNKDGIIVNYESGRFDVQVGSVLVKGVEYTKMRLMPGQKDVPVTLRRKEKDEPNQGATPASTGVQAAAGPQQPAPAQGYPGYYWSFPYYGMDYGSMWGQQSAAAHAAQAYAASAAAAARMEKKRMRKDKKRGGKRSRSGKKRRGSGAGRRRRSSASSSGSTSGRTSSSEGSGSTSGSSGRTRIRLVEAGAEGSATRAKASPKQKTWDEDRARERLARLLGGPAAGAAEPRRPSEELPPRADVPEGAAAEDERLAEAKAAKAAKARRSPSVVFGPEPGAAAGERLARSQRRSRSARRRGGASGPAAEAAGPAAEAPAEGRADWNSVPKFVPMPKKALAKAAAEAAVAAAGGGGAAPPSPPEPGMCVFSDALAPPPKGAGPAESLISFCLRSSQRRPPVVPGTAAKAAARAAATSGAPPAPSAPPKAPPVAEAAAAPPPPPAAPKAASCAEGASEWPEGSKERALQDWLRELDGGKGALLRYFEPMQQEFDADFEQIAAVKLPAKAGQGALASIDPCFWEV